MFMDECNLPMPRFDQLRGDPLTLSSTFQQSITTAALSVERTVAAAVNLLLDAQHRSAAASEQSLVNRQGDTIG
jgi:hypothetical protein